MAKEREIFINGQLDENGNIVVPGCVRNGIDKESANKIFDEMAEFAKYAFNKSHAAAYAVVSYRTAYLKAYYPSEFMAAMLNSFLGNQDKIPGYIEECKRLNIEILKPDINKSDTKFTVDKNQIRFGMGSIKNVGTAAVDEIVAERKQNGDFKDFSDFCERIKDTQVNKKCVESLIKAGAFDNLGQTRKTLMASFETVIDTIADSGKKSFDGQVSMFDLGENTQTPEIKYNYTVLSEYDNKELLSMEKEMLGLYISGHPLENMRAQIEAKTNINTFQLRQINNSEETDIENNYINNQTEFKDGQNVKYAGIITSVKKKYTKNNKLMAFVTVEDLYGPTEIIVFESCYQNSSSSLINENIVLVEGRLSIREDEEPKIVAKTITNFTAQAEVKRKVFELNITNLDDDTKNKLKGAIHFFQGDKNNIQMQIVNGERTDKAGGIYMTPEILKQFEELLGEDRVGIKEV